MGASFAQPTSVAIVAAKSVARDIRHEGARTWDNGAGKERIRDSTMPRAVAEWQSTK